MEQFVVRTPSLSSQSFTSCLLRKLPSYTSRMSSILGDAAGHKVYGIDKTLLVPLVQPSVDIIQGQVCRLWLATVHSPPSCSCLAKAPATACQLVPCDALAAASQAANAHSQTCCDRAERLLLRSGTESCCSQALSSTKTSTLAIRTTLQGRCKQT